MTVPYSREMEPTYESFLAECPSCGTKNTFNRASDLGTFEPIGLREVTCELCNCPFKINNDSVNAAYEMLLFGCYAMIERKEYMQCALSVAQAYKSFFGHFLHVQLIYRAYAHEGSHDMRCLHRLQRQLYDRVRDLTFALMRNVFLRLVIDGVAPKLSAPV